MKYRTNSENETLQIAHVFGETLKGSKLKEPVVVGLVGDLGAGKTTFIKGVAKGLGIKKNITSPTFLLWRKYQLSNAKNHKHLVHVDLYRIQKPKELGPIKIKELIKDPQNIVLIEWADKIKKLIPKKMIWMRFDHGKKENERVIEIK